MLHKKARPKRNKSESLLDCKGVGDLSRIYHDIVCSRLSKFGKALGKCIPVLSIFAFLGMISYCVGMFSIGFGIGESDGEAYATTASASSSLIIDNGQLIDNTTTNGNTIYSSHAIQVKASNIESYALTITGPASITNGDTTLLGAGGATLTNMAANRWGYAFGANTANNESSLTYQSFNGGEQTLNSNNPSVSNNAVDFTRKLVFTAKFDQDSDTGHYKANVKLNLTITPKALTWDDLVFMQDMTADICKSAPSGTPKILVDSRDNNRYTIQKLSDKNCWMTESITLDLSKAGIAASATSDGLPADWPVPALIDRHDTSSTNAWADTYTEVEFSKAPQKIQFYSRGDGNGYQDTYGYYYSWCAATAGTCSEATTKGVDASGSICPKGWKLPKGGTTIATNTSSSQTGNDFANLIKGDGINITNLSNGNGISWTDKYFAGPPAYITLGGANWYATGYVTELGLGNPGLHVNYWSRTANSAYYAHYISLQSSNMILHPESSLSMYYGYPIRCIAYSS